MPDERVQRALATIAVNYAKRWMEESVYDRAFRTPAGEKVRSFGPGTRYAIEAALNISSAVLIRHSKDDGLLARALKELGSDVAPELAKRLINGRHPPAGQDPDLFAGLSSRDLEALDRWARKATAEQKQAVIDRLGAYEMSDLVGATVEQPMHDPDQPVGLEAGTEVLRSIRSRVGELRSNLRNRTHDNAEESDT